MISSYQRVCHDTNMIQFSHRYDAESLQGGQDDRPRSSFDAVLKMFTFRSSEENSIGTRLVLVSLDQTNPNTN
jgi:hypothetical protein